MAISNVQSSTDAVTQLTQQTSKQQQTAAATEQANQARVQQQQQQQQQQRVEHQAQAQNAGQASKPVINTQGQTTGQNVNTTA
jgi:transcription initiation factor TFIID subunit TAF12